MHPFQIGMAAEVSEVVLHTNTAAAMASGTLCVYATPSMICLMEQAACKAIAPCLEEGISTVGVSMSISHDSATPVGKTVTAKAVLTGVDDRKLTFKVIASDDYGVIGQGMHERFLINSEKFLAKLKAKKS